MASKIVNLVKKPLTPWQRVLLMSFFLVSSVAALIAFLYFSFSDSLLWLIPVLMLLPWVVGEVIAFKAEVKYLPKSNETSSKKNTPSN